MHGPFPQDSGTLIVAAMILACTLTKDQPSAEIGRMAAFFTLLGDTLALMALHPNLLSQTDETETKIICSCN